MIPRIDRPGLHVLPTRLPQSALVPLLQSKTTALLGPLRAAFDFVVIDAPVAVGLGTFDWERTMLRQVDVLLVAVTGRDDDGTRALLTERDIDRKLRGIPVIASVPHLWGRQRPESALDLDFHAGLHREFSGVIDRVIEDQQSRRAL